MNRSRNSVLVIDRQKYWRAQAEEALQAAGYQTSVLETYEEVAERTKGGVSWDMVLLGCSRVEHKEHMLVAHLIARDQPVIVLVAALTVQDMRDLFLQGVEDVTDKTYYQADIITLIEQAQERIIKRDRPWKLAGGETFYEKTRTHSGR